MSRLNEVGEKMEQLEYCNARACGQGERQSQMHFKLCSERDTQSNTQMENENTCKELLKATAQTQ